MVLEEFRIILKAFNITWPLGTDRLLIYYLSTADLPFLLDVFDCTRIHFRFRFRFSFQVPLVVLWCGQKQQIVRAS